MILLTLNLIAVGATPAMCICIKKNSYIYLFGVFSTHGFKCNVWNDLFILNFGVLGQSCVCGTRVRPRYRLKILHHGDMVNLSTDSQVDYTFKQNVLFGSWISVTLFNRVCDGYPETNVRLRIPNPTEKRKKHVHVPLFGDHVTFTFTWKLPCPLLWVGVTSQNLFFVPPQNGPPMFDYCSIFFIDAPCESFGVNV